MASTKVLRGAKIENIALLFPGWDETLEREESEQEEKDLIEYAAVEELKLEVCFDYRVDNSENEKTYQQNEIDRYLFERREYFIKSVEKHSVFHRESHHYLKWTSW